MTATDTTTPTDLTNNPLMQREGLPVFDAIAPEHVVPGVEASLAGRNGALAPPGQNAFIALPPAIPPP